MAIDSNLWKLFDAHLGYVFKNENVTMDNYPEIFEKKFNAVFEQIKPLLRGVKYSQDELDELKYDCFHKYINKCSYQSPDVAAIEDPNHKEWLKEKSSSIHWNQWNAYADYLETEKKFSSENIKAIGELADRIVDRFEDPTIEGDIKVKGLLMGEVQSGKTGTFMAVLHKAVDVGWRFLIVLSGLTDDLRFQTQQRINSDFIGYTLSEQSDHQNCGIRESVQKYNFIIFEPLTTLNKDFAKSQSSKILNNQAKSVYIAVCKKNSRILKNLLEWLGGDPENPNKNSDRREIAQNIPCLIIDDEADQASPNTKKEYDEYTAVNGAIRNLLNYFKKSAYLAVTATPYANIFINPQIQETPGYHELPDLFPSNFIYVKPSPIGYTGVNELFGVDENSSEEFSNRLEEQVVIPIEHNDEELFSKPLKKDDSIEKIPPSLIKSLRYFFCCCVYKEITVDSHTSMLAHIDFRKSKHRSISDLIQEFYESECNAIRLSQGLPQYELEHDERYNAYKDIWENGCYSKSTKVKSETFQDLTKKNFSDIWKKNLFSSLEKIRVETINSDYKGEKLAKIYETYKNIKIILVGGNALSRGVTIEGLCVSYLTRKTATVDTLLQMGRFFGYKAYDIKIMKVWLTHNIKEMFEEASIAQKEFVAQVNIMNDHKQTPSTFGFKIHQAPAYLKLRIAAKNKMYNSRNLTLDANIAGYILQSSKLPFEPNLLEKNRDVVRSFIGELKKNCIFSFSKNENYSDLIWTDVDSVRIAKLISDFNAYGYGDINRANIADFIQEKLRDEKWIVTVLSNNHETNDKMDLFDLGQKVVSIPSKVYIKDQGKKFIYFSSGSLVRGYDFSRRLSKEEKDALKDSNSKNEISNTDVVRNQPKLYLKPQLIIYSVQPNFFKDAVNEKDYRDLICALAIGVPCNNDLKRTDLKIKYDVNNIYLFNLNQERGY